MSTIPIRLLKKGSTVNTPRLSAVLVLLLLVTGNALQAQQNALAGSKAFCDPSTQKIRSSGTPGLSAANRSAALNTTVFNTDFVSAGVGGLRNQASGVITLGGITGVVTRAYLYWHGVTNSTTNVGATINVNGTPVTGLNIGVSDDNCWDFNNSQAYRADVTALVSAARNATYTLSNFGLLNLNGASMIVFFDDGNTDNNRDVVIFDGNDSNIFFAGITGNPNAPADPEGWNVTLSGINYSSGNANIQLHVADGQDFFPLDDDALRVNSVIIAPAGDVFNGNTVPSANNGPGNNGSLWDIRSFNVTSFLTPGPNSLNLTTGAVGDCLGLIVALIDLPAGAAPPPPTSDVYYSKSTGDLHNVLTWGLNPDGSGSNPSDFNDSTFQLANRPSGLYTMTANWTVNGGTVNIPSGSQLQINGFTFSISELAGGGTISGSSTSNLVVIGTTGNNIPLSFTPSANTLNNLTLNRTGGTSPNATLSNALNVLNVLTLTSGTLNTGGYLTLKSTAAATARVAPVSGGINGDVTVERYIPARRAWRILSAPVGGGILTPPGGAVGQAALTTTQETVQAPLVKSDGTPRPQSYGTATFSVNPSLSAMSFTATIYNIDVTGSQTPDPNDNLIAAHIHVGAALGANAPVRWGFFGSPDNDINPKQLVITPFASGVGGTFSSTWDLLEGNGGTNFTDNFPGILAGLSYINFHTNQFGGGEIRGQIALVGASTQTVNQAWQEGAILGSSANPNPFPGYGTHITGGMLYGTIANGFDQNPVPGAMSSIKRYNGIINNWEEVPNTNATYVGSDAFMTFIRGDRGIPIGYNDVPPTNTTLRAKGPLRYRDQTFQVSGSGFTAIPNPFASPINFATITRNGVQNNFYLWDPKMGGDYGVGSYVLLSDDGMGGYTITPAPVSPESQYIQSGQGFLVRPTVAGTAGSVIIKESDKVAMAATDVFRVSGGSVINNAPRFVDANSGEGWRITLKAATADGSAPVLDEALVSYHSLYKPSLDVLDAVKMENIQENLGMVRDGQVLMVERKPLPQESDVVALKLWNTKPQAYILEVNPVNLGSTGLSAWLEDKYLKTSTPVNLAEKLQVSFAVGTDAASARTDRFRLVIGKKLPDALTMDKSNITAYPNPLSGRTLTLAFANKAQGAYLVTLSNASAQTLLRKTLQHPGGTVSHTVQLPAALAKGVYRVRVSNNEGETSFSITVN